MDFNEARDRGGSGISWTICKSSAPRCRQMTMPAYNYASTSSLNFYRPDALPDSQPTVSKHLRHVSKAEPLRIIEAGFGGQVPFLLINHPF